jgi:hypothetical protein
MTQLDQFLAMLVAANVRHVVGADPDGYTDKPLNELVTTIVHVKNDEKHEGNQVAGYIGFFSDWHFDEGGALGAIVKPPCAVGPNAKPVVIESIDL